MEQGTEIGGQGMLVLALGILAVVVTIAVYTELKEKRIPNLLTPDRHAAAWRSVTCRAGSPCAPASLVWRRVSVSCSSFTCSAASAERRQLMGAVEPYSVFP